MLILKKCCALPFILLSLNIQASSPIEPSETALAIASVNGYTIAKIDNCGQGISAGKNTFAIFADYDGAAQNQSLASLGFSGWNHSANENAGRPEWARLQHKGANYNFSGIAEVNESCNRLGTINMVLVKKVADWTMQHMNGFERDLSAQGYTFGDLASVVVDVKINREKTSIPSLAGLKSTYAPYLNAAAVAALDDGKVNISFTLGGADKVNATVIVQLDQASLAEQWLRLTIPLAALSYYREVNYQRTETKLADVSRVAINRLLVVGETKSGGVLRRSISPWAASVPEGFKEMDVSFKKIEFQLQ